VEIQVYVRSEALAGGELKHGTFVLITKGVVVGLTTQPDLVAYHIARLRRSDVDQLLAKSVTVE